MLRTQVRGRRARPRRPLLRVWLTAALCAALACALPPPVYEARGPEVRLSLLALGDWGRFPRDGVTPEVQLRVAEALADEDRRAPADALVFVGDNFYPH